jgi:hypothetical protein
MESTVSSPRLRQRTADFETRAGRSREHDRRSRALAFAVCALSMLMGACLSPTAPKSVAGNWGISSRVESPGPIFSMTLTQSVDSIGGTGSIQPAPGNFTVSGYYSSPCIWLTYTFANGFVERFSGRLMSGSEMSGDATASGCSRGPINYVRS